VAVPKNGKRPKKRQFRAENLLKRSEPSTLRGCKERSKKKQEANAELPRIREMKEKKK